MSKKIIGYTNEVPGDETTKIVPVYVLSTKQLSVKAAGDQLHESINALELMLEEQKNKLEALQEDCTHHVHRDEAGFPYDQRWCVLCGAYRGML